MQTYPENIISWQGNFLRLLDQRLLPHQQSYVDCDSAKDVAAAITNMTVRGAPAIGITAAYGAVLAAMQLDQAYDDRWHKSFEQALQRLAAARPTAVNLIWALDCMRKILHHSKDPVKDLLQQAQKIHAQERSANKKMAQLAMGSIDSSCGVLTHCNTGALATGGYGTALAVIRQGFKLGKISRIFADETRPWLQGARLTAWELLQDNIPVTLIADAAAAFLMRSGQVQWLIVGADRIMANADVANKIGTYHAAIAANYHGVKVMVVAPTSTVDMRLATGDQVEIEQRPQQELLSLGCQPIAAAGAQAWNPVFDVTPASLIDVIVTEKGVIRKPDREKMLAMMVGRSN